MPAVSDQGPAHDPHARRCRVRHRHDRVAEGDPSPPSVGRARARGADQQRLEAVRGEAAQVHRDPGRPAEASGAAPQPLVVHVVVDARLPVAARVHLGLRRRAPPPGRRRGRRSRRRPLAKSGRGRPDHDVAGDQAVAGRTGDVGRHRAVGDERLPRVVLASEARAHLVGPGRGRRGGGRAQAGERQGREEGRCVAAGDWKAHETSNEKAALSSLMTTRSRRGHSSSPESRKNGQNGLDTLRFAPDSGQSAAGRGPGRNAARVRESRLQVDGTGASSTGSTCPETAPHLARERAQTANAALPSRANSVVRRRLVYIPARRVPGQRPGSGGTS